MATPTVPFACENPTHIQQVRLLLLPFPAFGYHPSLSTYVKQLQHPRSSQVGSVSRPKSLCKVTNDADSSLEDITVFSRIGRQLLQKKEQRGFERQMRSLTHLY